MSQMTHFMSSIPTSLWKWIDTDLYACEAFTHALACHRPAWLYQRVAPTAPLRPLVHSMYPNGAEFWFWWAVCPQLINLKILRKHFTERTWLHWGWTIRQVSDIFDMVLMPRKHFREIPSRCSHLFFLWFMRYCFAKVCSKQFLTGYAKLLASLAALGSVYETFGVLFRLSALISALRAGKLSANVLNWEHELQASLEEFKEDVRTIAQK